MLDSYKKTYTTWIHHERYHFPLLEKQVIEMWSGFTNHMHEMLNGDFRDTEFDYYYIDKSSMSDDASKIYGIWNMLIM